MGAIAHQTVHSLGLGAALPPMATAAPVFQYAPIVERADAVETCGALSLANGILQNIECPGAACTTSSKYFGCDQWLWSTCYDALDKACTTSGGREECCTRGEASFCWTGTKSVGKEQMTYFACGASSVTGPFLAVDERTTRSSKTTSAQSSEPTSSKADPTTSSAPEASSLLSSSTSSSSSSSSTSSSGAADPQSPGSSSSGHSSSNVGPIVGGVVGGIALIALIAFGIWFVRFQKRKEAREAEKAQTHPYGELPGQDAGNNNNNNNINNNNGNNNYANGMAIKEYELTKYGGSPQSEYSVASQPPPPPFQQTYPAHYAPGRNTVLVEAPSVTPVEAPTDAPRAFAEAPGDYHRRAELS